MKKKIIFGYWFYPFGGFAGIGLGICGILFESLYPTTPEDKSINIALLIVFPIITLIFFFATCHVLFQFIVLSEEGIKAKTVWRTIRALKWEEIKEVRYERFYISVQGGFSSGWFVFDDGVERKQVNGLIHKNTHITVKANKRTRKIIETFWHEPIVEKTNRP